MDYYTNGDKKLAEMLDNANYKENDMNRCAKTGLTDKDWRTILDVVNVFDPNDIAHVYPEMGTPEFTQDVTNAFKAVLAHVERENIQKSHGGRLVPQYGPNGADSTITDEPYCAEAGPGTIL